ncbi:hypothetical protein PVL29_020272 [Vitis rotundifolia]|uniref:Uncharacterized protein n=1 Tax=Vitis rotundifolia TaxID=103349 RepID=A0AA38Z398_VITRO|nr:hypothetical protein PVL29_020272 [Vitis rotundifolia]
MPAILNLMPLVGTRRLPHQVSRELQEVAMVILMEVQGMGMAHGYTIHRRLLGNMELRQMIPMVGKLVMVRDIDLTELSKEAAGENGVPEVNLTFLLVGCKDKGKSVAVSLSDVDDTTEKRA